MHTETGNDVIPLNMPERRSYVDGEVNVFEKFLFRYLHVHYNRKTRFQKLSLWRVFPKSWIFDDENNDLVWMVGQNESKKLRFRTKMD